jgi:hypothetical protein
MCSASKSSKLSSNSLYSFSHTTLSYSAVHGSNQLAFASSITVSTFLYAFSLTVVSLSCLGSSAICHSLKFTHSGVAIIFSLSPAKIFFHASSTHSLNSKAGKSDLE